MSSSDKLASIGSRDHPLPPGDTLDFTGAGLTQKCIIIQRDEKGYGFTVSGDNPVYVASVKQDGAAARAGVQNGDRIIKVNGTLVTQRNHLDVVKLIKSGYYVALTLLGKPTPTTSGGTVTTPSAAPSNRDSVFGRVTAPQPVDPDKDRELWQHKVHMTRTMYETAREDFEKLQKLYVSRPSEKLHGQLLEKEKTVKTLDNKLKQLTGGEDTSMPSSMVNLPSRFSDSEHMATEHSVIQSWASSVPSVNTSDLGSMSDSPQTSPSVSPTPNDHSGRHNGQDMEDVVVTPAGIIHIDDEEVNSGDDEVNDPGPFADMKLLENKPAHLAVLLNYLISNSDPSPVLFHIISELYQKSGASIKELRKWAYEIFSTFIYKLAPLSISVEDNIISQIETLLSNSNTRTDSDNILRAMFVYARQSVQFEIADLLTDFRNKKDLGMGNLYGIQKVQGNMDRLQQVKVAEDLLMPHLKYFGAEDNNRSVIVDKDLATGWALATFLRSLGGPKSPHSAVLDRVQTFMMKDKKSIKFPGSRSSRAKAVKGHQFTLQHFYVTTHCSFCGNLIWGVGYQGYQCQSCDMTLHKACTEEITEQCGGKQKKRISTRLPLPGNLPGRRTSSSGSQQQQPSSATEQIGSIGQVTDPRNSVSSDTATTASTQPYPRQDDSELGATLSFIAGLPTGHSVKSIVSRYQTLTSPTGPAQGIPGVAEQQAGAAGTASNSNKRRGSSDLSRSGSLNTKEEKGERPARRANSDVRVDADTFKQINQSGSSSASSLSNRSVESPGNSTDNVSELLRAQNEDPDLDVEPELPPLKQVLPEEVLRKLKPKEKKRQEVINELFYTERAHLRNLKVLDLLFHRPMFQEKGIMVDLARALFPNMEEMISLHVTFVRDIKDRSQATPVVKDVGDLLLKRFDGEAGDKFRKGCAEYCRNQAFALDALKKHTRKEPKLQQFLHDAESNPLCRRLQLKDLMPSQMQRLTKYPLLIDSLMKYTQPHSDEYRRLERAHEKCKHILAYVNQAVKECENYHKLKDIQKKLDRKSVEGLNDPALADLKNLDLTQHKLIFDGPLTWKLRSHRMLDMHVLLFEDMLVLLQKQDDKYILKCQNTNAQPTRDDKYTHHPILKLQNLLARNLATEKRSFFVVNISESRAQMYEFTAASSELRQNWCKLINDKADEFKKAAQLPNLSSDFSPTSQLEQVSIDRNRLSRISRKGRSSGMSSQADPSSTLTDQDIFEVSDDLSHHLEINEDSHSEVELVAPEEVSVSHAVTVQSSAISSSLELLRSNGEKIETALNERGHLLAELLRLSWDQYLALTSQRVCPPPRQEDKDENDEDTDEVEEEELTTPEFLLAKAMDLNSRYIKLMCEASDTFAQQLVADGTACNTPTSRTMYTAGDDSSGQQPSVSVLMPMDQIKSMSVKMNEILANLGSVVQSDKDQSHRLKQELHKARECLNNLKQQQQQLSEPGVISSGRTSPCVPVSPGASGRPDIPNLAQGQDLAAATEDLVMLSLTSSLDLQQEREILSQKYDLDDIIPLSSTLSAPEMSSDIEGEMHHGIQEATVTQLEECVESLSLSSSSADMFPVVATETRTAEAGLRGESSETEIGGDDDDVDNEVSVADLPLPDLVSTGANDVMSLQHLHEVVDVDDSDPDSDDTDTPTLRTNYQDFPSLTTTLEDIAGEEREVSRQVNMDNLCKDSDENMIFDVGARGDGADKVGDCIALSVDVDSMDQGSGDPDVDL